MKRSEFKLSEINIGDIVEAEYNSGTYIGKIIEDRRNFFLVEVLAVKKHPMQGDLHNRGEVEGVAFHERKALAYREKMNARKRTIKPFKGEIPNYRESLKNAVEEFRNLLLSEDTPFHQKSMEKLKLLEKHYYEKIFYQNSS